MSVICVLSHVGLIWDYVGQSYISLVAMDPLVSMVTMLYPSQLLPLATSKGTLILVAATSNMQDPSCHSCCPWQQVFFVSMATPLNLSPSNHYLVAGTST